MDELAKIQTMVAQRVIRRDGFGKLERIAGCDVSEPAGDEAWAACVVLDYASLKVLDVITTKVKMRFPYIPTFLAFREL
ncbi:MAG: endonuclease V, partial [Candidatus Hadarchaeales archaeon]